MKTYVTPEDYAIAEANGLTAKHVYDRVYVMGWTVERAISQPLRKKKSTHDWEKWEHVAVVSKQLYLARVRYGWTHEKAAMTPKLPKDRTWNKQHRRSKFLTVEQEKIMRQNGLSRCTVLARVLRSNWSIEKAITTPAMTKQEVAAIRWKK